MIEEPGEEYLEALQNASYYDPILFENTVYTLHENSLYADSLSGKFIYPVIDMNNNYLGKVEVDERDFIPHLLGNASFVIYIGDLIKPMNELIAGMSVITTTIPDILNHVLRCYPSLYPDDKVYEECNWFNQQDRDIFISAYLVISSTIANKLRSIGVYTTLTSYRLGNNSFLVNTKAYLKY